MHKSYFHGSPSDYIQVVSHKDQDAKLKALGFVCSVDDLAHRVSVSEAKETDSDSEPEPIGIRAEILDCTDKDQVESIVMRFNGVNIDKRGSLETVKDKALAAVEGNSDER